METALSEEIKEEATGSAQAAATSRERVRGAKALSKALDTLIAVADSNDPQRFGALMKETGLPRTTLFRILKTFTEYGILAVDPNSRTYGVGPKLFEIARKLSDRNDLLGTVVPDLSGLAEELGETARLWIASGDETVLFDHCHPADPVELVHVVGARVPLAESAAALAILSRLPPEKQSAQIGTAVSAESPGSAKALAKTLRTRLGFAISTGFAVVDQGEPGVREIAAPILNDCGEAIAAISIACSEQRVTDVQVHEIGRRIARVYRSVEGLTARRPVQRKIPMRPKAAEQTDVVQVAEANDQVGANPVWDNKTQTLYWTDILGAALNRYHLPTKKASRIALRELTGALGLTTGRLLIAGSQSGFQLLDPETGTTTGLYDPELHIPGSRLAHGRVGPDGRFWAASMLPTPGLGPGRLYSLGKNSSVRTELAKTSAAKGLAWSPSGDAFYLTEASSSTIYRFEFDQSTGALGHRQVLIQHEGAGTQNGIAVDQDGCLWVAIYGGWALHRYAPTGQLEQVFNLPVPLPTSVAFGGVRGQTLFITSSRIHVPPSRLVDAPQSGGLFALETNRTGAPVYRFSEASL